MLALPVCQPQQRPVRTYIRLVMARSISQLESMWVLSLAEVMFMIKHGAIIIEDKED
jgi:hypothetical protein